MKAVYFFCCDKAKDPVAKNVFDRVVGMYHPVESGFTFDGKPVLQHEDLDGNVFLFAQTKEVLSHDYVRYLSELEKFLDCDFAGIVNWHEGANAPAKVLTVHTNSDVKSGYFSPTNPLLNRNMIQALEQARQTMGLDNFSTKTEATHWSGVAYGQSPDLISKFKVPLVDIEIGSEPESWKNEIAANIIAQALTQPFKRIEDKIVSILYIGGEHFDQKLADISINSEFPFAFSHHLPNQWVRDYVDLEGHSAFGEACLEQCKDSIIGGVDVVIFHKGMRGALKALVRDFAKKHNLPVLTHNAFNDPAQLLRSL